MMTRRTLDRLRVFFSLPTCEQPNNKTGRCPYLPMGPNRLIPHGPKKGPLGDHKRDILPRQADGSTASDAGGFSPPRKRVECTC